MTAPLNVAFVWHMHQPYYRDLLSDRSMQPWTLLHGTKDYLHIARVMEAFPTLHHTVNLVPSLVQQLADHAAGQVSGPFVDVCRKPSHELTDEDRQYILRFFFSINHDKVIARYPPYLDLLGLRDRHLTQGEPLPEWFWPDAIGWFNLAWIDGTFIRQDPALCALASKPHFDSADLRLLFQRQTDILAKVIPTYRDLQDRGQVELSTSPYYHPVLPLVIDNHREAWEARPGVALPAIHFHHPEDAAEQIRRARSAHREHFGQAPAGLWPSEGGVSQSLIYPVARAGIRWIASDEEILNRSRGWSSRRFDGTVEDPASLYSAYSLRDEDAELSIIFRDRGLSDEIGFKYQAWEPGAAAQDLVNRLHGIRDALGDARGEHIVPLILDGENCWEFYDNNGEDFLVALFELLSGDDTLGCVTVSEYLDRHPPTRQLDRLASGSWIGGTFDVWIGEMAQNVAWDYLARAREDLVRWQTECEGADMGVLERAWEEIYIAEGSDWFWWYYSGNDPNLERGFDAQFRKHLMNVYTLMGSPIPEHLTRPILDH